MAKRLRGLLSRARPPLRTALVMASPRSGTTWLKEMLNGHPEVFCTERRLFGQYLDVIQDEGAARPRARITLDRYVSALAEHYDWRALGTSRDTVESQLTERFIREMDLLALEESGKTVLVDKITPYPDTQDVVVEALLKHQPRSKQIQLIRDGRDVATSLAFHWLTKSNVTSADEETEQSGRRRRAATDSSEPQARFFTDEGITRWATQWLQAVEIGRRLAQVLPSIELRYEEMKADLLGTLEAAFSFLEVDTSRATLLACEQRGAFKVMSGGREPGVADATAHVRKGVVGDWRAHFTRADGQIFHRIAGRELLALGYERSPDWVEALPERLG